MTPWIIFTFNNMLSAVFCTGGFRGMSKKINKSPDSNSAEPEKVMPYERARARPKKFRLLVEKGNLHPRGKRTTHSCPHERHWLSVSKLTRVSQRHYRNKAKA